jgi:hypothetical protein
MKAIREIIRIEIHTTAAELRALKRWWRTPPDDRPEPPVTRFALTSLKRRATLLCMTMAHSRRRLHLHACSGIAEQEAELVAALDAMDRMKVQTPLLDTRLRDAARAILAGTRQGVTRDSACVAPTEEHRA